MKKVLIDTNIYPLAMCGEHNVVDMLRKIDQISISTKRLFSKDKHFRFVQGL
jgi:hypothetical protein